MSSIRYRPTYVEVDLLALEHNYRYFAQSALGQQFICPMVKANAYGCGDLDVVAHLQSIGAQRFGVGLIEEALRLREVGQCDAEIMVFGFSSSDAAREIVAHNLTPVISDLSQLESLLKEAKTILPVHLKLNTGMNRLGFSPDELSVVFEKLKGTPLQLVGLCTHLMSADDIHLSSGVSRQQLAAFAEALCPIDTTGVCLHAYNTSGALGIFSQDSLMSEHSYGLRPGIGLLGYSATDQELARNLRPVMSLKSRIVSTQHVAAGQSVSYGGTWTAAKNSVIGIAPIGYADGIPTQLSNQGWVVGQDQKLPIVGRVCMDYTLIDVSALQNPLGTEVEFFGAGLNPHEVATAAQTHVYDIFTRLSERVPRVLSSNRLKQ